MSEIDLARVMKELEKAARSRDPRRVVRRLVNAFIGYLTPENVERAVRENLDLFDLVVTQYRLADPSVLPLFKAAMRMYWPEFEEAVTNVPRLYDLIKRRLGDAPIASSPEFINYLNSQCESFYKKMYQLVWS
jgi:hypothetical protein